MVDLLLVTLFQLAAGAPASAPAAAATAPSSEDWFDDASDETDADPDNAPANDGVPVASPGVDVVSSPAQAQQCSERPVTGSRRSVTVCQSTAETEERRDLALRDLDSLTRLRDTIVIQETMAAAGGRN